MPLSAVAEVRLATGPAEIRRANQERVAVISAAPVRGDLGDATVKAQEILAQTTLPVGILGSVSGQSEEMTQSFRSLGLAFALAVFLVYLVMASQFESLLHPFVILFTIPMGLIGSVWGLYITGTTINSVALIGLIMLAGIVVNNAIVLIDAINQARERGLAKIEAIKLAGQDALAPDPHHQREHHHRPHPDGDRHRRRRGDPPAHGHHRDRRQPGGHVPHAHRDPGAVRGARSQGVREVGGRRNGARVRC